MNDIDIKEIRVNLGISQEKLAEMVGVSPRTVQNWESGSKIPNSKHAILRSLLLKDTPQYAGGGEEIKKPGKLITGLLHCTTSQQCGFATMLVQRYKN